MTSEFLICVVSLARQSAVLRDDHNDAAGWFPPAEKALAPPQPELQTVEKSVVKIKYLCGSAR